MSTQPTNTTPATTPVSTPVPATVPLPVTGTATDTKLEKIRAFNQRESEKLHPTPDDKAGELTNQEKIAAKAKPKTPEEIAQEQADLIEEQRRQQVDALHQVTSATSTIIDRVNAQVNPLKDWIASQPTPGGIAALLIAIGIFALLVIPVNAQGQTRAYLLWQTIMNRTHMKYRESINPGGGSISDNIGAGIVNSGTGASGDFGPSSNGASGNFGSPMIPGGIDLTHLNLFGAS